MTREYREGGPGFVDHNLPYDNKTQRLKRRYQGLARVAAAINDLYIYGV